MTPKPLPESSVLVPHDPSIWNPDDWPEFRLNDVTITQPETSLQEPVSLLLATEHCPVRVTGRLEPVPKRLAHTVITGQKQKAASIEISATRSFAYGAYEDGSIDIWAAGNAGWFAISPSETYRPIYNEMIEAINVLYFIADAYRTPHGGIIRKRDIPEYTAKDIFEQYAQEVMECGAGAAEAAETMYKHREFLISSMMSGKEGMAWSGNSVYKHLYKRFPKDFTRIRQRLEGPTEQVKGPEPIPLPVPVSRHTRQPSLDSASTTSSLKRKRGRPPKHARADVISMESSSVGSSTAKEASKGTTTKNKDNSKIEATSKARPRRGRNAKAPMPLSAPDIPEAQESQLDASPHDSDSDAVPQFSHRGKSALRLKPSKSSKGPPRVTKSRVEEEEVDLDPPSSPVPAGKRKRNVSVPDARQPKRRSSRHEVDEGIDMPTSPSSEEVADSPDSDTTAGAVDTTLPLRLNHVPDPVQEDTWVCALDGCTHKVYSASLPDSQHLIREHYALHAYDDDERVQMVKKLQAPSLPVNRLMEKVRMQAKVEGFPGSRVAGTRFPEPLKQRY